MFVCFFVCLFVCLFVCVLVCLFVCETHCFMLLPILSIAPWKDGVEEEQYFLPPLPQDVWVLHSRTEPRRLPRKRNDDQQEKVHGAQLSQRHVRVTCRIGRVSLSFLYVVCVKSKFQWQPPVDNISSSDNCEICILHHFVYSLMPENLCYVMRIQ